MKCACRMALSIVLFLLANMASAQVEYQPYSYQFYQKLNSVLYSTKSNEHTALKPSFMDDSLLKPRYDSLMNYGQDGKQHSLLYQKLFNEHLIDFKGAGATFYADVLPDVGIGRDLSGHLNTNLAAIGA
ncbi:MAG TPA: gliding motility protein RemB, partial [Mucilaginibacter sp.]|nr:gliding motility protein RemB [Mucilaginibacter sp.]